MSTGPQGSAATVPLEFRNVPSNRLGLQDEIADVLRHTHLLSNLVRRDLTVRYKRSVLGFLWTMLNPLLMMVVLTVVFSTVFRFEIKHYETYFLSEYLGWVFFSQTTVSAMASLAWNGPLMKKVRIPKSIFALATTLAGLVNLALAIVLLGAIMLVLGMPIRPTVLFLPVSLLLLALFTFGVALAVSAVSVYFTDVREMYQIGIMVLMYLTPVLYPLSIVPARFRPVVLANPLLYLLELLREPLYYGRIPPLEHVGIAAACAIASLAVGWLVFRRLANGFHVYM